MNPLLLEIGTEEIPAGYIQPALEALAANLTRKLSDARIAHGAVRTYGTPRRLSVWVDALADRQQAVTQEILGPPERIAFDQQGNPTLPAEKFAEKVGLPMTALKVKDTEKGRYLTATITDKGITTRAFLQKTLPDVILATPFPKAMRWSDLSISFARPIQTILALLGKSVIAFKLADRLKSGRQTFGHRFLHPGKIRIEHPDGYLAELEKAGVIADIERRKQMVREEIAATATALGGRILTDEALVDIVANLVETPVASGGRFDEGFLELPPEILITAMRQHQKYFAVVDAEGKLMPCFVAVNNTPAKDMDLVAKGHQRVLRARLSDARFFFRADRQEDMENWNQKLHGVLFQAQLGSMHAKVQRVEKLAAYLAEQQQPELKAHVFRAAHLCKADLVSQVVFEFANLQGIMGRYYALMAGEPEDVAAAIEEHYRPTYSGGPLPTTRTGALLAVADKLDSICGCFSVGLVPTGASDPYALRRQGIGIVQIMLAQQFGFSLKDAIIKALEAFEPANRLETAESVYTFLQNRIANLLAEEGYAKDLIAAVIGVTIDPIPYLWKRLAALQSLKGAADFEPLAAAFKRAVNILRKAEEAGISQVDQSALKEVSEIALYEAHARVRQKVEMQLAAGDPEQALRTLATLRDSVDRFFDDVMVMAEDPVLRRNRLALLQSIAALFNQIADFSKIAA